MCQFFFCFVIFKVHWRSVGATRLLAMRCGFGAEATESLRGEQLWQFALSDLWGAQSLSGQGSRLLATRTDQPRGDTHTSAGAAAAATCCPWQRWQFGCLISELCRWWSSAAIACGTAAAHWGSAWVRSGAVSLQLSAWLSAQAGATASCCL